MSTRKQRVQVSTRAKRRNRQQSSFLFFMNLQLTGDNIELLIPKGKILSLNSIIKAGQF